MELPGSDFASYRWGNTVDPITPGFLDRGYVARELVPFGSPESADLLTAFDRRLPGGLRSTSTRSSPSPSSCRSTTSSTEPTSPSNASARPGPMPFADLLDRAPGLGAGRRVRPGRCERRRTAADAARRGASRDRSGAPRAGGGRDLSRPRCPRRRANEAGRQRRIVVIGDGADGLVDVAGAGLLDPQRTIWFGGRPRRRRRPAGRRARRAGDDRRHRHQQATGPPLGHAAGEPRVHRAPG